MDDPATAEAQTPAADPILPVPSATAEPATDAAELDQAVVDQHRAMGIDPATGFAFTGEYPTNGRLRAEALSRAGVTTDPDGIVTDAAIVETGDRLAREDAEAARITAEIEAARPSDRWSRDDLAAYAARIGAAHEGDANKKTILAAIHAIEAPATKEA